MNTWLLIAAFVATVAITLHVYTFEHWIWPKLPPKPGEPVGDCFPSFPFGGPDVVRGFYRTVWHFFTVNLLVTIVTNILVGIGTLVPYGMILIYFLIIFWILIFIEIWFIGALLIQPGQSYIKSMLRAFQWVFVLLIALCMYLGTKYQV